MIGKLKGIVDSFDDGAVLLDVGGVCYEIFCSDRTQAQLSIGEAATLIIETHVREDHFHLYGFINAAEREWFRTLSTVQRVGNKVALAILNAHTPPQLLQAILAKDTTAFSRISGIGGKLAERIVTELKDKVLGLPVDGGQLAVSSKQQANKKTSSAVSRQPSAEAAPLEDLVSALSNLGYTRSDAYAAAAKACKDHPGEALPALIRHSLKELA